MPGRCDTTEGALRADAVVNWLWKFANAFPDKSVTPLVASTVIVLETGRELFRVTTRLSAETLIPVAKMLPFVSKAILFVFSVLGFKDLEKVRTACAFGPIPDAPFCGVSIVTTGAVVSEPTPVVNALLKELLRFPERSSTPDEATCTVIVELPGSGDVGVNVNTFPVPSRA